MKLSTTASILAFIHSTTVLGISGLVGYGIQPFDPICAMACQRALSGLMLACSTPMDMAMEGMTHGPSGVTSPSCRAGDAAWLTTLAYCVETRCAEFEIPTSELQGFWERFSTDDPTVLPKWDYRTAVLNVSGEVPTKELGGDDTELNVTSLVNSGAWLRQYNVMWAVQRENVVESGFGVALLVAGFGIPLVLTWLGYLPFLSSLGDKIKPYLIYPAAIGTFQVRPLPYLLGNAPTVGQSLYIVGFIVLNVILTAANYQHRQPNGWYPTLSDEVLAYIFYRTGVFSFVLLPLLLLFSSRNNFLLWLTNWSHSTFVLLHRWVARLCALHALLHTLTALPLYYPAEAKKEYWIWGAVATIALMILVFCSGLYVRNYAYEFFLVSHIVLSIFVIAGCWYHVKGWIGLTWGYETWLYAASAVWFFDRLVRVGRMLKNGVHRAKTIDIGGGYIRVDIPGPRWGFQPGYHVYTFFPTVTSLRPWENHPFSVVPTASFRPIAFPRSPSSSHEGRVSGSDNVDLEEHKLQTARVTAAQDGYTTAGITLLIKKSTGMARYLQAHDNLLTLLDGPYPNNAVTHVLRTDRLLLIGGGIGITGVLAWAFHHPNVKLAWSVRDSARPLVDELGSALNNVTEKEITIGQRLNFTDLFSEEVNAGWERVGVVVSGPGGLCDDVRAAVVAAGKTSKTVFELEVDAYSW
ncbi:ferric reductase-like transmembrane component [Polyplosphaeria fusca]|uniref:Ferric reductase-like transmembrane component n=1 Tax=Polyplosphaeria fusca TaxID=682080 RepID=A0A9P4R7R9_9PLEO|nr:ferric reductase-like transmembrane component [Polyplosphaeria fusca]